MSDTIELLKDYLKRTFPRLQVRPLGSYFQIGKGGVIGPLPKIMRAGEIGLSITEVDNAEQVLKAAGYSVDKVSKSLEVHSSLHPENLSDTELDKTSGVYFESTITIPMSEASDPAFFSALIINAALDDLNKNLGSKDAAENAILEKLGIKPSGVGIVKG